MKENEMMIEDEKLDESSIELIKDYSAIVTNITIVPQKFKNFTSYNAKISVKDLGDIKVKVDESLVNFVKTCQRLNKPAFTSKTVVKEKNIEKNKIFTSIKFISISGSVYRYFISRADTDSLDLTLDFYNSKNKN